MQEIKILFLQRVLRTSALMNVDPRKFLSQTKSFDKIQKYFGYSILV